MRSRVRRIAPSDWPDGLCAPDVAGTLYALDELVLVLERPRQVLAGVLEPAAHRLGQGLGDPTGRVDQPVSRDILTQGGQERAHGPLGRGQVDLTGEQRPIVQRAVSKAIRNRDLHDTHWPEDSTHG